MEINVLSCMEQKMVFYGDRGTGVYIYTPCIYMVFQTYLLFSWQSIVPGRNSEFYDCVKLATLHGRFCILLWTIT